MLMSRPFMVEFSGTPEAGKTTTINAVADMLRKNDYKTIILKESAESLPSEIPKGTFDANMWMHFITQSGLISALYSKADIVLIDRGIIDSEFYGQKFLNDGLCTKAKYDEFKKMFLQHLKSNLFIALMVTPEESVKRRGGEGRLVNKEYIQNYNEAYLKFFETIIVNKHLIMTDNIELYEVCKTVLNIILKNLP